MSRFFTKTVRRETLRTLLKRRGELSCSGLQELCTPRIRAAPSAEVQDGAHPRGEEALPRQGHQEVLLVRRRLQMHEQRRQGPREREGPFLRCHTFPKRDDIAETSETLHSTKRISHRIGVKGVECVAAVCSEQTAAAKTVCLGCC